MSRSIADWNGPGTGFTITGAVAFVDTLTLFLWRPLPPGDLKLLRQHYGRRMQFVRRLVPGRPRAFRAFLTLQQPDAATLTYLAAIQKGRSVVHSVHIPIDFLCADRRQALLATEFLTVNLMQKWRRRDHRLQLEKNTRYWKRAGKAPRNIALYGDRLSKPVSLPCAHLELRFTSAAACKRAKLNDLHAHISGVDVMSLLKRQTAIRFVDRKRVEREAEMTARATVRRRSGWRTVADLKRRAQNLLEFSLTPFDDSSVAAARAREQLWELRPKLGGRLVTASAWEHFTPTPMWHCWRGGNTTHNHHLPNKPLSLRPNNRRGSINRASPRHNQLGQVRMPVACAKGSRPGERPQFCTTTTQSPQFFHDLLVSKPTDNTRARINEQERGVLIPLASGMP